MHYLIIFIIILVLLSVVTAICLCRASINWRDSTHDYELDPPDSDDERKDKDTHS